MKKALEVRILAAEMSTNTEGNNNAGVESLRLKPKSGLKSWLTLQTGSTSVAVLAETVIMLSSVLEIADA